MQLKTQENKKEATKEKIFEEIIDFKKTDKNQDRDHSETVDPKQDNHTHTHAHAHAHAHPNQSHHRKVTENQRQKNVNDIQEKYYPSRSNNDIQLMSLQNMKSKRQWNIFKAINENNSQTRILYLEKNLQKVKYICEKKNAYKSMTGSLCCTAEIDKTL